MAKSGRRTKFYRLFQDLQRLKNLFFLPQRPKFFGSSLDKSSSFSEFLLSQNFSGIYFFGSAGQMVNFFPGHMYGSFQRARVTYTTEL